MATTVSFINFKGGVGKTTITIEMGASLAHKFNEKVLIIDLDPQTNASFSLMKETDWQTHVNNNGSLLNFFEKALSRQPFDLKDCIVKTPVKYDGKLDKLDLLPSHIDLFGIDLRLATHFGPNALDARTLLKQALQSVANDYTYILIDCPPNLYLCTQNALFASEYYLIVALPEFLSTLGIATIQGAISNIFAEANRTLASAGVTSTLPEPKLLGILFNRLRYLSGGTSNEEGIISMISKKYGDLVFKTKVPQSTKLAERPEIKIPISISGYAADREYETRLEKCAEEFYERLTRP
jgi:chromosome partitioning protein